MRDGFEGDGNMKKVVGFLKRQPAGRRITVGFAIVILLGSILLRFPCSVREGAEVTAIDALFTATSAVCVTGLAVVDTADHFTPFGQGIVALLIQTGGLGVTSIGVGIMIAVGRKVGIRRRSLVKEALNMDTYSGLVKLVKGVLILTLCFEGMGAIASFIVFVQDYEPLHALGISIFHSVASFNNSGFDVLGGFRSLTMYRDNLLLNLTTCLLVFFGGIGFLVIMDLIRKKSFKKLTLHSKVVLSTSIALLIVGTLLLKITENISWMGAFFYSVSARTAGFSTYSTGSFTKTGLFTLCILMFIGASPGSTGGGIKTSTFFVLAQSTRSMFSKNTVGAFRRSISRQNISKAHAITMLSGLVVISATFLMCIAEPDYDFLQILFEVVSAFGTVGLSTGITPELSEIGKVILIFVMFTGRLGAMTLLTIWVERPEKHIRYTEETIAIG